MLDTNLPEGYDSWEQLVDLAANDLTEVGHQARKVALTLCGEFSDAEISALPLPAQGDSEESKEG